MRFIFVGLNGYELPHTRVRCYNFAKSLRERGVDARVLSYHDDLGTQYTENWMYSLNDFQKIAINMKALKRLWPEKGNVIYMQKAHYHSAASYLCHRFGRNEYIFDYDDYDVDLSVFFRLGLLNRLFFKAHGDAKLTRKISSESRACVAASRALEEYISGFHKDTHYIPTGVDIDRFTGRTPVDEKDTDEVVLAWIGLVWGPWIYDNVVFGIKCFAKISEKYPNAVLKIVGGGTHMPQVKEETAKNYPNARVEFIDWIDPNKMPDFLRTVDIGLLPFVQNDMWVKSKSPTKSFEYLAMELAILASNVGEITHVIEDGVHGYLASDEEEYISKMEILIQNRELRRKMGIAARDHVRANFSLPVLGDRLLEMMKKLYGTEIVSSEILEK